MAKEINKGDVPTLILSVLRKGPCHGYGIARDVELQSENALRLREGSLYPALRLLEQKEFITSEWAIQETGPARKIYTLTEKGQAELTKRVDEWNRYTTAIGSLLEERRLRHA